MIAEANRASGQDEDVVALLEDVHETLRRKFEEMAATTVKGVTFAQELMTHFTAEDLEEVDAAWR